MTVDGPPDNEESRPQPRQPPRPPRPRQPRRPLPSPLAVITVTLGLFLIVLTLMAIQVRNGRDPAIGPGPTGPRNGAAVAGQSQAATPAASVVSRTSPVPP